MAGSNGGEWLSSFGQEDEPWLELICFPFGGAGAEVFRNWDRHLPSGVRVTGVELPGHMGRLGEMPYRRLSPLVEVVVDALVPLLERPFAIYGHSMGALLGFEVARRIRRELGRSSRHLFVLGWRAPHLPPERPPLSTLPDAELIAELREINGQPMPELDYEDFREAVLPTLRADLELLESYVYSEEPPLDCPITALRAVNDALVGSDAIAGWKVHTAIRFDRRTVPGNHILAQSEIEALLSIISSKLNGRSVERA